MAEKLLILYEHAAGYGVFKVQEFEEIGMFLPQLEAAVSDLGRFNSIVKLIGFAPFKTAVTALENMNAVSEGIVTEDLKQFLDISTPKGSKKSKIILGVSDPKLGASISEALEIKCSHIGAVPEILRGIRHHFPNLVKGFTWKSSAVAQLGLGHSYSRAKIKFNVHRTDTMIVHTIGLVDQLDKDINTFSMRLREWYSYHFPELYKICPENHIYSKLVNLIKNRKELSENSLDAIEEITMDSSKARAILDAARSSMGMDISIIDLMNIKMFSTRVISLINYRKHLGEYLHNKMTNVAPNLSTLVGDHVGARLIAHAGSLTNLAKYPASTVQILGAEKALFRALKTRGNTPKYGLLFHSTFIGRAGPGNKGRISRFLANKCSIASRIDCFTESMTSVFGEKLKQQVEDRLKFYETGDIPKKNVEVMKEAIEEFQSELQQKKSEKKKKKKKRKSENIAVENNVNGDYTDIANSTLNSSKKKKKKRQSFDQENVEQSMEQETVEEPPRKKKKKNKNLSEDLV